MFKALDEKPVRNAVFQGAVVKANGTVDRTIRTYLRAPTGLADRYHPSSFTMSGARWKAELFETLVTLIAKSCRRTVIPFTHTGGNGVYRQRHRLAAVFHDITRKRIEAVVQKLLNESILVKGKASGSKEDKWLDVPNGPFANGVGEFVLGADKGENK